MVHVVSDESSKVEEAGPEADAGAPVEPKKSPLDFMDLEKWPIPVCVAWIAWRDHARVSMAYSEWRKRAREMLPSRSFRDLHQDCIEGLFNVASGPTPIPEAAQLKRDLKKSWESDLKKALREGMIVARGKLYNNKNDDRSIKPDEWRSIDNIDDYMFTNNEGEYVFGVLSTENSRANGYRDRPIYISVTLLRDEVLALWPPIYGEKSQNEPSHGVVTPAPEASGPGVLDAVPVPPSQIRLTKDEIEQAYIVRAQNWPEGRPSPNEVDDWNFLKSLSPSLPRERAREIRSAFAPDEWRRGGRPRRN